MLKFNVQRKGKIVWTHTGLANSSSKSIDTITLVGLWIESSTILTFDWNKQHIGWKETLGVINLTQLLDNLSFIQPLFSFFLLFQFWNLINSRCNKKKKELFYKKLIFLRYNKRYWGWQRRIWGGEGFRGAPHPFLAHFFLFLCSFRGTLANL